MSIETTPTPAIEVTATLAYPVDERAFHVVRRNLCDGSPEVFLASDRATLSGFPAKDRDDAYAMVASLNGVVKHHVERALAALQTPPAVESAGEYAQMREARNKVCARCDGLGRLTMHSVPCIVCNGTGETP